MNNAEVVVRGEGGVYATVANREDGTYTFTLPRASEAVAGMIGGYRLTAEMETTELLRKAAEQKNFIIWCSDN